MKGNGGPRVRGSARKRRTVRQKQDNDVSGTDDGTPPCAFLDCHRPASYRPLVGSDGDFLCDTCYRTNFPATAMVDEVAADDAADGSGDNRLMTSVRRQITSAVKTASDTLLANDNVEEREEEECRLCLDPGVLRRCCSRYYCHHCYYVRAGPQCPGCGAAAHLTGIGSRSNSRPVDPGRLSVAITWLLTLIVALAVVLGATVSYVNWRTAPITIWDRHCRGWFPRCELDICIDASNIIDGKAATMPYDYQNCNLETTISKVVGKACIFDQELYDLTDGDEGFDFCATSPRNVKEDVDSLLLPDGAYVLEDSFNNWVGSDPGKGIAMASARWNTTFNAQVSDICGFHNNTRAYTFADNIPSTPGALTFSGFHYRYADTTDLNVVHGGRVEFHLIMGAVIYDMDAPESPCKPTFGGDVTLAFSIDEGTTWTVFGTYTPYRYRSSHRFTAVEEVIPQEAWTNRTRFRWRQFSFDPYKEYWAIDDVRVFARFENGWRKSIEFTKDKILRDEAIHASQCCLGTEQCSDYGSAGDSCKNEDVSRDEQSIRIRLHTSESFVLVAVISSIIKSIYLFVSRQIEARSRDVQHKILPDILSSAKPFPKQSFHLRKQSWWLFVNVWLLVTPLLAVIVINAHSYVSNGCSIKSVAFFVLSVLLDAQSALQLLARAFRVSICSSPLRVTIDTNPDHGFLAYGRERVPLGDLMDIHVVSACYVWVLYVCTVLSGLPFAAGCYSAKFFGLRNDIHRIYVRFAGACTVTRALLGCNFAVKLLLSSEWVCTPFSREKRDEMGRALKRRGVYHITFYVATATIGAALVFNAAHDLKSAHAKSIVVGSIFGGILLGMLVHMMRGLPVIPHILFTRYPTMTYAVVYQKKWKGPCSKIHTSTYCSAIHSTQRIFLAYLDDKDLAFVRLLRGDGGGDDMKGGGSGSAAEI